MFKDFAAMDQLHHLAELIHQRNRISNTIAALIGRPAETGHLGEFIAAHIFNITLHASATQKSSDGYFVDPPLAGRSVNIKWYTRQERMIDLTPAAYPDYYLVLAGPQSSSASSRGTMRPLVISSVFLFDARVLHRALTERAIKLGIATSVARAFWEQAEIYPMQRNTQLALTDQQRSLLALFDS
jgi:hypothetical protein